MSQPAQQQPRDKGNSRAGLLLQALIGVVHLLIVAYLCSEGTNYSYLHTLSVVTLAALVMIVAIVIPYAVRFDLPPQRKRQFRLIGLLVAPLCLAGYVGLVRWLMAGGDLDLSTAVPEKAFPYFVGVAVVAILSLYPLLYLANAAMWTLVWLVTKTSLGDMLRRLLWYRRKNE